MKLLLLGGPRFLGRAIVDAALERGHELTFFNRGTTNPELYPEVERIVGDRKGGLDGLARARWDAVVDTCGYLPRDVRASAEALAGRVSIASSRASRCTRTSARRRTRRARSPSSATCPTDEVTNESYGALKALCESAVRDVFGARALVVRPGLIVGPHDPTGRFTYWPHRIARGGEVLAPGPPERPTQVIDVRDLAEWTVALCEAHERHVQRDPSRNRDSRSSSRAVARSRRATRDHVGHRRVPRRAGGRRVDGASALACRPGARCADRVDVGRAIDAGLAFRPLEETIRATLAHAETIDGVGLTADREAELLAAWHGE